MNAELEATDSLSAAQIPSGVVSTVMVVDDDPANLQLMEKILQSQGYEVRSFPMGRMALAAASERPPDLILLDINMPEMTGYEVCDRLKANAQLSKIPVIFLSGMNAAEDRLRCFRCGGVDYVSKSFEYEELCARVDTHLRLRRLQQEVETNNSRLQELVDIQVKKTADGQQATIFAIAKLAEARDDDMGRHLERVQLFCKLLATGLSRKPEYRKAVDDAWIRNIFHASPLHDIGKVAIPDRILLKPGPLTPEEFTIMKTHAALGAQTLRAVLKKYPDNTFIEMGIEVAQAHHERWDGTGYPDGLAGEEIPVCARILAVADCYDALRSKRCYKSARTHDDTCATILQESGTHFDPVVADLFRETADKFRDVWNWVATVFDDSAQPVTDPFRMLNIC